MQVLDDDVLICVDTNILLRLYEIDPDVRQERLDLLEALGESLFVPHQVKIEFHQRREDALRKVSDDFAKLCTAAEALRKTAAGFGASPKESHTARIADSIAEVKHAVGKSVDGLVAELAKMERRDPRVMDVRDDHVLTHLERILEGKVGRRPDFSSLAEQVRNFEQIRVPLQIPPGFADSSKGGGSRSSGDYLIWVEMLEESRRRGCDLVFVTDDEKADWWVSGAPGLPEGPHPLLVAEFERVTGIQEGKPSAVSRNYVQVTGKNFFHNEKVLGKLGVDRKTIPEHDEKVFDEAPVDGPAPRPFPDRGVGSFDTSHGGRGDFSPPPWEG